MSSETELDALLRHVPDAPPTCAEVADERIIAVRTGRLPEGEAAASEGAIADDPEARGLLMALAEPMSPTLRARALAVLPRRPAWWAALWAIPLAAAAAAGLWLAWPRTSGPEYLVEGPFGGQQVMRSEQASTLFGPHSRFKLVLRPRGEGAEAGRVFVDGRPVVATVERGEGGVFRVQALGSALFSGPAGPRTVQVMLGSSTRVAAAAHPASAADSSVIELRVEWRPEGVEP